MPTALGNRFLRAPLVAERGEFLLPDGPGLGIEPDEERLRHHSRSG